MRWALLLMLAGCGSESGDGGGLAVCPGCARFWGTCEQDPDVEAPCCPQGLTLTAEDCPEGTTLRVSGVDNPTGNTVTECRDATGAPSTSAPYISVDNATGRTRAYGVFEDAALCYPETGFQRLRSLVVDGRGCLTDCYGEDGKPADCVVLDPPGPACPPDVTD